MKHKSHFTIILISGIFLILDQFLKYQSLNNWSDSVLINNFFGWKPFINTGAAFGLPLPSYLIIIFTLPIIVILFWLLGKEKNVIFFTSWSLILFGALSNLFDRIYFGGVIDYWLILTGIINLADVMIVGGLILFLGTKFKKI